MNDDQEGSEVLPTPFDRVTALVCAALEVPLGLVSVLEDDKAVFRAQIGVGQRTLPREISVSARLVAMGPEATLVVPDALDDPELCNHPWVSDGPRIRFFAGATICDASGKPIGAVAAMDTVPRDPPTPAQMALLRHAAHLAGDLFDQVQVRRGQGEQLSLLALAEAMAGVGHFRVDAITSEVVWSDEVFRIHGLEPGSVDPSLHSAIGAYHPDDAEIIRGLVERALETGEGYEAQLRLTRADGEERVTRSKARCEFDETGTVTALFGVFQDITDSVRAHERVVRSEAGFRLMSETSTDIIARYGPDARFTYLSPAVEAILGRTPEEMLGHRGAEYMHPDDRTETYARFISLGTQGQGSAPTHIEYRALKPDGTVVWLEASPRAIFDDTGALVEIHDHVRDITARKAAEREQAELVETLKMAETLAGLGHWRWDIPADRITWSDEVYRMRGRDPATFSPSAKDELDDFHPDDQGMIRETIRMALDTEVGFDIQMRLAGLPGERIVQSRAQCETDASGQVVALFGVTRDVTERERAVERLKQSETRYRLLADRASDIIVTYGVDGLIRYMSPSIEAATGVTAEALVGRPVTDLILADDLPALTERFKAMVKTPAGTPIKGFRYRSAMGFGEARWFEARTTLVRDGAGRVVEFQDVVRDITATKALEDELIASRDIAEAGARAKSEFLANMSHELRTPLTSVVGFSGLLKTSPNLPDVERKYADRIAAASEALLSVINDILDYSKLEADAVDLEPQAFDPRAMVEGAVAIVETQCITKGLTLETVVDPDIPDALMGDEGRLRQVTLNFLSNAVKFTGTGTVRLAMTAAGDRLRVAVTDSGIGIAPDKIEALFDRFTQADASTTRVYGGTGLGLAISRRLIEMMGGLIGADSVPGTGSTFWFEVPLQEADLGAEAGGAGQLVLDQQLKILMADDAAPNRELVTAILGSMGVALETVEDGAQAVEAVRDGGYDLILMDVHMPVMDGLDATRAIRAMGGAVGRTPIIALTANVQPEQVLRCRDAGMDGHVGKPIQISELMAALAMATAGAADDTTAEPLRSVER